MDRIDLILVTTRGKLSAGSASAGRPIHNQTAGAPPSVEAARSLSDLSHQVFVPLEDGTADLMFVDFWSDLAGLRTFFSNPQVEEGGKAVFSSYERTIWTPADDFVHYHVPAPYGRNERYVGLVRGTVRSREEARRVSNEVRTKGLASARRHGSISHQIFFRQSDGGPSLEMLGVDFWYDAEGMLKYYRDPNEMALMKVFDGPPQPSVWRRPAGEWVEW
jgi:hypothetical protein